MLLLKDVAPSHELRRWFSYEPNRFQESCERDKRELRSETARATLAFAGGRYEPPVATNH
ncbi:MAG TPA: DUF488 family protein [Kofleriaceae bacterium]|nr:DUF488 family protein [Kofleriaceae bacterium]